jgi:hypothetical protein
VPILILVRQEASPPQVEHACKQLVVSKIRTEFLLLLKHLHGLERLLVPLLDRNLHFVFAKAVKHVYELLQSAVALLVEAAVRKELVHRILLPLQDHCVEELEHDFGDEELRVVLVVLVHLLTLACNFLDTVIVSAIQMLQLAHKVITFASQSTND